MPIIVLIRYKFILTRTPVNQYFMMNIISNAILYEQTKLSTSSSHPIYTKIIQILLLAIEMKPEYQALKYNPAILGWSKSINPNPT